MKSIAYLMLPFSITVANAHEFPSEQVERHCRVAMHYITYELDDCVLEQYAWFELDSQSEHYPGALWYGQKRNWRGEVVGMDFKLVIERVEYLKGINK